MLYNIEKKHIVYTLSHTSDVLFAEMRVWFESNKDDAILDEFFKQAKHFTGVHHLKADVKQKLLTITMQYSETVSKYYRQIFELWQNAETSGNERIEKFICTL